MITYFILAVLSAVLLRIIFNLLGFTKWAQQSEYPEPVLYWISMIFGTAMWPVGVPVVIAVALLVYIFKVVDKKVKV